MRENFLPLFEEFGVDLVLAGHSHSYERSYFLNGQYGLSSTFNPNTHTVGENGFGSGQINNGGPYYKSPTGPEGGDGAVYVTAGSSGKTSSGPINHAVMYFDAISLGSCVLKIRDDTLSLIYLRQTGAIDDKFVIIKNQDCAPGLPCNDFNACTINDIYDNNCLCKGVENLRLVTVNDDAGPGSLREAVVTACDGDTIRFSSSVNDTIRLQSEIPINKNLIIDAVSADDIVLSGNNNTRIFKIESGVEFSLSDITLYGGNHPTAGGALLNNGVVILDRVTFAKNRQGTIPKPWTNNNEIRVRQGSNYILLE